MTGEPVTTLYDYQLSMLHVMCRTAPAMAADLLERIGATQADTETASNRRWFEGATNKFSSLAEYETAWGAPVSKYPHPGGVDISHFACWDLSFWPGMQIELMEIRRTPPIIFRRLLRKPGTPQPRLESVADLTPWSCTQEEFENSDLGPFDYFDGFGDHNVALDFQADDPESGRRRSYRARFEWGLLQSVHPVAVNLKKPKPKDLTDPRPIDDLILAGETYQALLKIKVDITGNGTDALAEYQRSHARLAQERPNDFQTR